MGGYFIIIPVLGKPWTSASPRRFYGVAAPSTQQQPTFRRSGRSRHISPIQSLLPYKEPDLSTQEPSLTPPQPTPCTEYSVYSSHSLLLGPRTQLRTAVVPLFYGARSIQQSLFLYAAYSSHSCSTQHTAVTLFLRSIQQSLLRSIQQSLFFYAAVAPPPPAAAPLFRIPSLLPEIRYRISASLSELLKFLRFAP